MNRINFLLATALIVACVLASIMTGCSNLTPAQNLNADKAIYSISVLGLSGAVKANQIPATDLPRIQADLATAKAGMDAGQAWIKANPNLANTVGVYPSEFTLTHAAVQTLFADYLQFQLIAPLPLGVVLPSSVVIPPATQPVK